MGAARVSHASLGSGLKLGNAADFSGATYFVADDLKLPVASLPRPWMMELWIQVQGANERRRSDYLLNLGPDGGNRPALIYDYINRPVEGDGLEVFSGGRNDPGLQISDQRFAAGDGFEGRVDELAVYDLSDQSTSRHNRQEIPRVRSMLMNGWLNPRYVAIGNSADEFRPIERAWELVDPGPSRTWVLIDEREDSINEGDFEVNLKQTIVVDFPASYHGQSGALNFADGHSETKRWLDPRTRPAVLKGLPMDLRQPSPGNPDLQWLQQRTTARLR